MSKDGKTRYIIEIKYVHDKKGENVEMVEITTDDIHASMKQYARNRQPLEWRIKHDYGKGL
jgi:hypothetical protein|tara:strand:+ start:633 stop:815 length:183 start_codon:yes stop_codon:yes gene_type:complete